MMKPKAVPAASPDEDVGPDHPTFVGREVVAGQRRDRRPRGRRHGSQREPRQQQAREAAREGAEERGQTPEDDRDRQQRHPLGAVDEQPHGDREDRSHQQRDRAQQAEVGVVDVQPRLELGRDRSDRRGVGSVERQHEREQHDHARPGGPTHALDDLALGQAPQPAREAAEQAPLLAAHARLFSHHDPPRR